MTTNIRVHAKKSLGQNFLVNEGVLDRIVAVANISPSDTIVEIGPGTGALTQRLVATKATVVALEKDRRLIEPLQEHFIGAPNVSIVEADILTWQPPYQAGSYKVVANIPYYLTSHLLRLMLESWPSPSRAVLMVQHEVAKRMMARPPDMNLLALSVQLFARPSLVMRVSPGSFRPMPDVDSAVITLDIEHQTETQRARALRVLALAKPAFAQKRKQLTATIASDVLKHADIKPSARPQELSIAEWIRLAGDLH
jgi:16S rRNA (adenine1518-N6/adenine1519-N6)-dimethyltransferase